MVEYCSYPGAWTSHPEALHLRCDRGTDSSGVGDLVAPSPSFRARLPPPASRRALLTSSTVIIAHELATSIVVPSGLCSSCALSDHHRSLCAYRLIAMSTALYPYLCVSLHNVRLYSRSLSRCRRLHACSFVRSRCSVLVLEKKRNKPVLVSNLRAADVFSRCCGVE